MELDTQILELPRLDPGLLDNFLAAGWFRMQQKIFTTSIEWFRNGLYEVIWLRVDLNRLPEDKEYLDLKKKNSPFTVSFTKANISREHEALFELYKNSRPFEASSSINALLFDEKQNNIYNTWMINVFDANKLIGCGFFDLGNRSAAGISSFYHPDYKKHRLGLYMIYEKMHFCKQQQFNYFYPGYYSPTYPAFDYKLKIGKPSIEWFDTKSKCWYQLNK